MPAAFGAELEIFKLRPVNWAAFTGAVGQAAIISAKELTKARILDIELLFFTILPKLSCVNAYLKLYSSVLACQPLAELIKLICSGNDQRLVG